MVQRPRACHDHLAQLLDYHVAQLLDYHYHYYHLAQASAQCRARLFGTSQQQTLEAVYVAGAIMQARFVGDRTNAFKWGSALLCRSASQRGD